MTEDDQTPSLRDRNRDRTRRAILEAIVEIELAHGGALDPRHITYARIAEIAGVSERTVYRFFPTKEDLDRAYSTEQPILLDLDLAGDASIINYPAVIEEIMRRWSERLGHRRIAVVEPEADAYPESMAARRRRDIGFVGELMALVPGGDELPERQQVALAAAVHSTQSIRTIAITAQRWDLTLEEAGRAHAFVVRSLLERLATAGPEPWEASG